MVPQPPRNADRSRSHAPLALAMVTSLGVVGSLLAWTATSCLSADPDASLRRAEVAALDETETNAAPAEEHRHAAVAARPASSVSAGPARAQRAAPAVRGSQLHAIPQRSAPQPVRAEPPDRETSLHLARIAELDALRAQETRDQAWASDMEEGIATSFASEDIEGSALSVLSCSRTLCAVEVDHESRNASDSFAEHFDGLSPDHGAAYVAHFGDDSAGHRTTIYMAREGSNAIDRAVQRVPE